MAQDITEVKEAAESAQDRVPRSKNLPDLGSKT